MKRVLTALLLVAACRQTPATVISPGYNHYDTAAIMSRHIDTATQLVSHPPTLGYYDLKIKLIMQYWDLRNTKQLHEISYYKTGNEKYRELANRYVDSLNTVSNIMTALDAYYSPTPTQKTSK
jgi:hypothetical protein